MDYLQFTSIPRKNKHLTLTERIKIELLLQEGKTPYGISKVLQRLINTILNEIQRGTVDQIKRGKKSGYILQMQGNQNMKAIAELLESPINY